MVYSYTQEEVDAAFGNTSTPTETPQDGTFSYTQEGLNAWSISS